MTVVSRIAKFSRVDGHQIDFHLDCKECTHKNRIRLGPARAEMERSTCEHFHDYNLDYLKEGIVYFQFAC